MEIPFHDQKGEDGEGDPAQAGEPVISGDDGSPEVVQQHQGHCDDVQGGGGQFEGESGFHGIQLQRSGCFGYYMISVLGFQEKSEHGKSVRTFGALFGFCGLSSDLLQLVKLLSC